MNIEEELKRIISEAKEQINSKDYQIQEMKDFATRLSNTLIRYYDYKIKIYKMAKSFIEQEKELKIEDIKDSHDIINFSNTLYSFAEELRKMEREEITDEE